MILFDQAGEQVGTTDEVESYSTMPRLTGGFRLLAHKRPCVDVHGVPGGGGICLLPLMLGVFLRDPRGVISDLKKCEARGDAMYIVPSDAQLARWEACNA